MEPTEAPTIGEAAELLCIAETIAGTMPRAEKPPGLQVGRHRRFRRPDLATGIREDLSTDSRPAGRGSTRAAPGSAFAVSTARNGGA